MILKKKSRVRGLTRLAVGTSHGNQDRGTGARIDMYIGGVRLGAETNPDVYGHFMFDKGAKTIQQRKS